MDFKSVLSGLVTVLFISSFATIVQAEMDTDADNKADDIDNCPTTYNPDQKDTDWDMMGDACDADADNDGVPNAQDSNPLDSSLS